MTLALHERALLLGVTERQLVAGAAPWYVDELVATDAARARLVAWVEAGGLARPRRSTGETGKALAFYGDELVWAGVVSALDRVPPPVADYIVDGVTVMGVGWALRGVCFLEPISARKVILVSGGSRDVDQVVRTALHEIAHAWLEPDAEPEEAPAARAFEHAAVLMTARAEGWAGAVAREIQAMENRAHNLVRRWATG